jgi:hypothetical protein
MAKQTKTEFVQKVLGEVMDLVDNHADPRLDDKPSECDGCKEGIERILRSAIEFGKRSAKS